MRSSFLHQFAGEMIDFQMRILSLIFLGYVVDTVMVSNSGGLADLAKILGQLAGGDDCVFRCPKGEKTVQ